MTKRTAVLASAIAVSLLGAPGTPSRAKSAPLPVDLEVEATYGEKEAGARRLDEIGRTVLDELARRPCYRTVRREGATRGPAARLLVTVSPRREETVYEIPLAQREGSHNPDDALRYAGIVELDVQLNLFGPADGKTSLASRRFHLAERARPTFAGDDVIESAWRALARQIAVEARRFACRAKPADFGVPEAEPH